MVNSQAFKLDHIFHALSDSTRRSILRSVALKEKTVGELSKPYRMSLAAVSKHLKVLENAKLIKRKKQGSFQLVSLNAETLKSAEEWFSFYQRFWNQQLDALQNLLEKGEV